MDAPDREPVTVKAHGIIVRKTLNLEDFDTLAIVYEVSSNRDDDTRIHIEDNVPADISPEDIGFHSAHKTAESSISAESVTFEDYLAPGDGSKIVLGIKNSPEDDLEVLMDKPTVELLETDAMASGSVSIGGASNPERAGAHLSSGGVVRVLAKELRREEVGEEARRHLSDELLDTEAELEDQISELEEQVDEFEVYKRPIEDFLSDYGPAERIFSTIRDDLTDIEEAVRTMQDRMDGGVSELEDVRDRIESTQDELERVDARIETLQETLENMRGDIGDIDNLIQGAEGKADEGTAGVRALEQRASDLEENVADVKEEYQSIRESIRGDIREIETGLEEFESFRDRLSAAFGDEAGALDIESDDR